MSNKVITLSNARQLHNAFKKTDGNFDTTASRLLTERMAEMVLLRKMEPLPITRNEVKLAASMAFQSDGIEKGIEKKVLSSYASIGETAEKCCLNRTKFVVKPSWNYEIVSLRQAWKSSYSVRNFVDILRHSRAEKGRLAKNAEAALQECMTVILDCAQRIAKDKERDELLHSKPFGQR